MENKEYEKAVELIEQELDYLSKHKVEGKNWFRFRLLLDLVRCKMELDNLEDAEENLTKALALVNNDDVIEDKLEIMALDWKLSMAKGDYDLAKEKLSVYIDKHSECEIGKDRRYIAFNEAAEAAEKIGDENLMNRLREVWLDKDPDAHGWTEEDVVDMHLWSTARKYGLEEANWPKALEFLKGKLDKPENELMVSIADRIRACIAAIEHFIEENRNGRYGDYLSNMDREVIERLKNIYDAYARYYGHEKEREKAEIFMRISEILTIRYLDSTALGHYYCNNADIYYYLGDWDCARAHFNKGICFLYRNGNYSQMISHNNGIAHTAAQAGDYAAAITAVKNIMRIMREVFGHTDFDEYKEYLEYLEDLRDDPDKKPTNYRDEVFDIGSCSLVISYQDETNGRDD